MTNNNMNANIETVPAASLDQDSAASTVTNQYYGVDYNDYAVYDASTNTDYFVPEQQQDSSAGSNVTLLKARFYLTNITHLLKQSCATDWLVKGFFTQDSVAVLYAQPAVGKSVIAISLSASIALGLPWHGHRVTQGAVVYIAGEGQNGITKRFLAWALENNVSLEDAPIFVSNTTTALDTSEGVNAIIAAINSFAIKPALIIIDTLARSILGDESSTSGMNALVAGCDAIRTVYKGSTVLLVHHTGLIDANRPRGSSVLSAAVDASYLLKYDKKSDVRTLLCDKLKDGKMPADKHFMLEEVCLDELDEDGDMITSVVFRETDKQHHQQSTLKTNTFLAMSLAINKEGFLSDHDEWREAYCQAYGDDIKPSSKTKAFSRAVQELQDLNLITTSGKGFLINLAEINNYKDLSALYRFESMTPDNPTYH